MLFYPVGSMKAIRAQGGFISDEEIENVVKYLQTTYGAAEYDEKVHEEVENAKIPEKGKRGGAQNASGGPDAEVDELFLEAVRIAIDVKQISASYLQRNWGSATAARPVSLTRWRKRAISARATAIIRAMC